MHFKNPFLGCLLVSALTAGCLFAGAPGAAAEPLPAGMTPRLAVPRLSRPPQIDGTIGPDEWKEAVAISGVSQQNPPGNLLVMRPTTYYLGWDAGHLYLACRTWIMPGYTPHVAGREPGAVTAFDDGMELHFKPQGRNVAAGRADSSYKFFISALGNTGDLARVSVGQMFRTWQPRFHTATRLTKPGSAPLGGRWWECEAAMSLADFELDGPNRAGDTWKMLLGFNHIPGWMQAAIPINSGYLDPSGFLDATLVENQPAAQVTMDELPGPLDGRAVAHFRVYNPAAKTVPVNILAEWSDWTQKKSLLKRETTLQVAPGQTAEYSVSEPLPDLGKDTGSIHFEVTPAGAAPGKSTLLRYFTFFKLGYEPKWVKYTPPPAAFPLQGSYNPVRNNLLIKADTYYLDNPQEARSLHYRVLRESTGTPVAEGTLDKTQYFYFTDIIPLPRLQEGQYRVEATLRLADGRAIGPVTSEFQKLDEAKVFSAWWNNKLGDTERIIPPFVAVKRPEKDKVTMWGRAYRLDALGMPRQIASQGGTLLAAPARIVVVRNGKQITVPLQGMPRFTEDKAWRHSFAGSATGAGLTFSVQGSVEQDGLALLKLTYAPLGKAPVHLDALRLEFPLRGDEAECLVCIGPGGNFGSYTARLLQTNRQGRLWSTLETGKNGSLMTVGSFYPDVWVGNEKRGFLWWADSDAGWVPDDAVPAHEVLREGRDVVLRNNIIGRPYDLQSARTLTFSYMASPFKPLVKGWRLALHSEDGTFTGPHKVRTDPKTGAEINGWDWLSPPSRDPQEWSALWAGYKQKADERVHDLQPSDPALARNGAYVHTSIPLSGYGPFTPDSRVAAYFAPEWGDNTLSKTQSDYTMWLADRAFREGGLRTIYWDIFYVTQFQSLQNGMGYKLPDGRVQPAFNGFLQRRFMMRLRSLADKYGLLPGALVAHSTNNYPLVVFPWMDAVLDGEWAEIRDSTPLDWVDNYSLERMRAMSVSENWGTQISWMNLIHITDKQRQDRVLRGFLDYQRLHDTWSGQDSRMPPDPVLQWGLNDARTEYVPYWRNDMVTSGDKSTLTALWRLPDRAILMVFNDDGQHVKDARLHIDWKKLGVEDPAARRIAARTLAMEGDPPVHLETTPGTLDVPGLQPHTARYIGLRYDKRDDAEQLRQSLEEHSPDVAAPELEELLDWGMAAPGLKFSADGQATAINSDDPNVHVSLWRLPDRVVLQVTNAGAAPLKAARLHIDLAALGLKPQLPWQEFVRVHDFGKAPGASRLEFYENALTVPNLPAHGSRLVGVRRF